MKVDSAQLRAFASTMDDAGAAVDALDVIGPGVVLPVPPRLRRVIRPSSSWKARTCGSPTGCGKRP